METRIVSHSKELNRNSRSNIIFLRFLKRSEVPVAMGGRTGCLKKGESDAD